MKSIFITIVLAFTVLNVFAQQHFWANKIASSSNIIPATIASDANNNFYCSYFTWEDDTVVDPNSRTVHINRGSRDFIIVKFDENGNKLWSRQIAGAGKEQGGKIIADDAGNIYALTGFQGTVYLDVDTSSMPYDSSLVSSGDEDCLFAKYDPDGNLLAFKKIVYGAGRDRITGLAFNYSKTEILAVGFIRLGTASFEGSPTTMTATGQKGFFARFDLDGNCVFKNEYFDCSAKSSAFRDIVSSNGNYYVCADYNQALAFDDNLGYSSVLPFSGSVSCLFGKINENGAIDWLETVDGSGTTKVNGIASDEIGNLYAISTNNSDVTYALSGSIIENQGSNDVIVSKYTETSTTEWIRPIASSGNEYANALSYDGEKLLSALTVSSSNFIIAEDTIITQSFDPVIVLTNTSSNNLGAISFGGVSTEESKSLITNGNDNIYSFGVFSSSTININDTTLNNPELVPYGFITRLCPPVRFIGLDEVYCNGSSAVELKGYPTGGTFSGSGITGNVFSPNDVAGGTYEITYTNTSVPAGCANSYSVNTTVTETVEITGLANEYCEGEDPITLTGTPAGGIFTVDGDTVTEFDPTTLIVGDHIIKYYYNEAGSECNDSTEQTVTVNALPILSFSPLDDVCINGDSVNLSGFIVTSGNAFSGTGVLGTYFRPAIAGLGNHTITYSYTDANGCSDTAQQIITVNDTTGVSFNSLPPTCENAGAIDLASYVSHTGGVFSGNGVSNSKFYSDIASTVGSPHTIEYIYTNAYGCNDTSSQNIIVNAIPVASASVLANPVNYGEQATLQGSASGGSGSGYSYLWSPADSISDPETFKNPLTKVSQFTTEYSLIVIDDNSCSSEESAVVVNVVGGPLSLTAVDNQICPNIDGILDIVISGGSGNYSYSWSPTTGLNDPSIKAPTASGITTTTVYTVTVTDATTSETAIQDVTLTVLTAPTVGVSSTDTTICEGETITISTIGTTATYEWDNSLPNGEDNDIAPTATTTYSVTATAANTCTSTASLEIIVNTLPTVIASANDLDLCLGETATLSESGADTYSWTNGITPISVLDVSPNDTTTYYLTGTITATGCQNTDEVTINVNPLPNVKASISNTEICEGETVTLSATGAESYNWTDGTNPVSTVESPTSNTKYYVAGTILATGCQNNDSVSVSVILGPNVTFNAITPNPVCENGSVTSRLDQLVSPLGGMFSGNGVITSGSKVYFYPSIASSVDSPHDISYTYTDGNGCSKTITQSVVVNQIPTVTFDAIAPVCVDASPVALSASPLGGTFSGVGVSGSTFNPAFAGVGTHTLTYSYADGNGCIGTATQTIVVNALPNVAITNLNSTYCINDDNFILAASKSGGIFYIENVAKMIFEPSNLGTGTYEVRYEYTDANGCYNEDIKTTSVNSTDLSFTNINDKYCDNESAIIMEASPSSGTFTINGIEALQLSPSTLPLGTNEIKYIYTNATTLCTDTIAKDIEIVAMPTGISIIGLSTSYCESDSKVILSGSESPNGTFSINGEPSSYLIPSLLGTGTHTVAYSYYDDASCATTVTQDVTINAVPSVSITAEPVNASICQGDTITLTVLGADTYTWSEGAATGNTLKATPISDSKYVVTVANIQGCEAFDSIEVSVFALPTVSMTNLPNFCLNANEYELSEGSSNNGGIYSGNGVANGIFNPTSAGKGTHDITYTTNFDENGCNNSIIQSTTVNDIPEAPLFPAIDDVCINASDINLDQATPSGGIYSGNGVSGNIFNPASAGVGIHNITYTTAPNASGCTNYIQQTITVNDTTPIAFEMQSAICVNEDSIQLQAMPAGGAYTGNGISNDYFIPSLAILGDNEILYSFTNGNGCISTISKFITVNDITSVSMTVLPEVCLNSGTQTIEAFPENGIFSGDGMLANTFYPSLAGAGVHPITYIYKDVNNCTDTAIKTITVNTLPVAEAVAENNSLLLGGSTKLLGNASGGAGEPYEFAWSPKAKLNDSTLQSPQTIALEESTIFELTVKDAAGCESYASQSIVNVSGTPLAVSTENIEICVGDTEQLLALVSGGSGKFSITWTPSTGLSDSTIQTPKVSGLQNSTNYIVEVIDSVTNDTVHGNVSIMVNQKPILQLTENSSICSGDSIDIVAEGALLYKWNNALPAVDSHRVSPAYTTEYAVTGYSDKGCSTTVTTVVSVHNNPSIPTISYSGKLQSCLGDSVVLSSSASPDYNYIWSDGSSNLELTARTTGDYSLVIQSAEGCLSDTSNIVSLVFNNLPEKPVIETIGNVNLCNGESVILKAPDATGYMWSNGMTSQQIEVSTEGKYSVIIENNALCESAPSDTVTIIMYPEVQLQLTLDVTLCQTKEVTLTASGGDEYLWSNGKTSSSITVIPQSVKETYNVTATNLYGCSASGSINVNILESIELDLGDDIALCVGENLTLNAGNADSYSWSTGASSQNITIQNPTTGYIYSTITVGQCTASDSIYITVNEVPTVDLGEDIVACQGDKIILSAEGHTSYLWNTGSDKDKIEITKTGTYSVTVSNGHCESSDIIDVTLNAIPEITFEVTETSCLNPTGSIKASVIPEGNYSYYWESNAYLGENDITSLELTKLSTGVYNLVVTNGNCSNSNSVMLNDENVSNPIFGIVANKTNICKGDSVQLIVKGSSHLYAWGPVDIVSEIVNDTIYAYPEKTSKVYVSAISNGCQFYEEIEIFVNTPNESELPETASICSGGTLVLEAGSYDAYIWNTGESTPEIEIVNAGTYTVTAIDNGCSVQKTIVVSESQGPEFDVTVQNADCGTANGEISINSIDNYTYLWDNGETNSKISGLPFGSYAVSISNNECTISKEFFIEENDALDFTVEVNNEIIANGIPVTLLSGEKARVTLSGADSFEILSSDYLTEISASEAVIFPKYVREYSFIGKKNTCSKLKTITIDVINEITVDLGADTVLCAGDNIVLDAGFADKYVWNTGETSRKIVVSKGGTYSVKVWQNSAIGYDTIFINEKNYSDVTISSRSASCSEANGIIFISNPSKYEIQWNGNTLITDTLRNLSSGIYTFEIADNVCPKTFISIVESEDNSTFEINRNSISVCDGEADTISVQGAANIEWSVDGALTKIDENTVKIIPKTNGVLAISGIVNGCSIVQSIPVMVNTYPIINLEDTIRFCESEGTILSTKTTEADVLWSNGLTGPSISILNGGTYSVTATRSGCSTTKSVVVEKNTMPNPSLEIKEPSCGKNDGAIFFNTNGAFYSFEWAHTESGSSVISNIPQGTYSVIISNASCSIEKRIDVNNAGAPELKTIPQELLLCEGDSAEIIATGASSYEWTDMLGNTISTNSKLLIAPKKSTIYSVKTESNSCVSQESINVTVYKNPTLSFSGLENTYCENSGAVELKAYPSGGIFTLENENVLFFEPSLVGIGNHNIEYSYSNQYGCESTITKAVYIQELPDVTISNVESVYCSGTTINPIADPYGGTFYLNGILLDIFDYSKLAHEDDIVVSYSYTDPNSMCEVTVSAITQHFEKPIADFEPYLSYPDVVLLNHSENASKFEWNFGDGTINSSEYITHEFSLDTTYNITLTVSNIGCDETSVSKTINYKSVGIEDNSSEKLLIYPTKTDDFIYVKLINAEKSYSISIVSEDGKTVLKDEVNNVDGELILYFEVKDFAKGIYEIVIEGDNELYSKTFIKS